MTVSPFILRCLDFIFKRHLVTVSDPFKRRLILEYAPFMSPASLVGGSTLLYFGSLNRNDLVTALRILE